MSEPLPLSSKTKNRLTVTATSLLLVLPFSAQQLYAQEGELIIPGSSLVDGSLIEPQVDTLQMLMVQPDGSEWPVSRLERSIEATDLNGTPTWTIVQSYESESKTSVDTSIVSRLDLAPLYYVFLEEGGEQLQFTFDEERLSGTIQPANGVARIVNYELNTAPFNAAVDIEVVRALPLETGLEVHIPNFKPPHPRVPTHIRVTESEVLSTAGGEVEAWVVAYDAGDELTTLWIAKDNRRFLRSRTELNDMGTMWELPVADLDAWRAEQ